MIRGAKYGNRKVRTPDGDEFDSAKEYRRWCELTLLEKAGTITDLRRQVEFILIPPQWEEYERYSEKTGKRLRNGKRCVEQRCSYIADFVYQMGGQTVVEDAKGLRTSDYIIKRKLMLWLNGIRIKES